MPASRPDPGRTEVALLAALAAVAGSVDVLAYTRMGHVFASVVTGNLIVGGVSVDRTDLGTFQHVATAVLAYGAGVAGGSIGTRHAGETTARWPLQTTILCVVELGLMCLLAGIWIATGGTPRSDVQYLSLALASVAMGVQSAASQLVRVPGVSSTYLTGTFTGLLSDLVTCGRVNTAAVLALLALLAGATATGLLEVHTATVILILPLPLLLAVVVTATARRRFLALAPVQQIG